MGKRWRGAIKDAGISLALLVMLPVASDANRLLNGSFESPDTGPGGFVSISPGTEPDSFGWWVTAGDVEVFDELNAALPGPSFDGTQHLDLNGVTIGVMEQEFDTFAGAEYVLDFVHANNYVHTNSSSPAQATVSITNGDSGDLVAVLSIQHGTSSIDDLDWTLEEIAFTATASTMVVEFASNSPTVFGGSLIDDVHVPEPGFGSMITAGGLALLFGRRSYRPTTH